MSKGEIVRHLGEGQYQVRQLLAVDRVKAEIARLKKRNDELAIEIPQKRTERLQLEQQGQSLSRDIDLLIPDLMAGVEGTRDKISDIQADLVKLRARLAELDWQITLLVAENLSKLKRRSTLERVPESRDATVWCADYSVSLSGEVGLIDINDEGGQGLLIKPGYETDAAYVAAEDGALTPNDAQSGPQIYFNAAILPGVQKWFPRYRLGEIRFLQGDTCTVRLDEAKSSAQDLPINQVDELSGVPILYMECNGSAFAEGDRVVVRYTDHGPLVVGFEKEPHQCAGGLIFRPSRLDFSVASGYSGVVRTDYGSPYQDEEGQPINYPLGTAGAFEAWVAKASADGFRVQRGAGLNYGTANWIGRSGQVLSWMAPPGRVHRNVIAGDDLVYFQSLKSSWVLSPFVYYRQTAIDPGIGDITGAGLYRDPAGKLWLMAFNSSNEVYRVPLNDSVQMTGPAELLEGYNSWRYSDAITGWYFSDDGSRAVCTFVVPAESADDGYEKRIVARWDGVTFLDELVYDQADIIGQDVHSGYASRDGDPPDPYTYSNGDQVQYSKQAYAIPLYYEYVGNDEVEVLLQFGAESRNRTQTKAGSFGGGDEQNSTTYSYTFNSAAISLKTSQGDVIATIEGSFFTETESSEYSNTSAGESFTATNEQQIRSILYALQFIDARTRSCVAQVQTLESQQSGSGDVYAVGSGSDLAVTGSGHETFTNKVALFVAGAPVAEHVVDSYDNDFTDLILSDKKIGPITTLPKDGTGVPEILSVTDLHKLAVPIDQELMLSALAYSSAEATLATASVIVSDSLAVRLFHKTGGDDQIDDAIGLGEDVFLLEPGRV